MLRLNGRSSLYRGVWLGIVLDNGLTMACSSFWQPPAPPLFQWQTGTLLGLPLLATCGNIYFKDDGDRMPNGGAFLHGYRGSARACSNTACRRISI